MNRFEADIDAQYRAVTSSCRAYIQCMEMNGYYEQSCSAAQAEWSASQERFVALSVELHKIALHRRGPPGYPPGWGGMIGGMEAGARRSEKGD